jgi:hypothetical protein
MQAMPIHVNGWQWKPLPEDAPRPRAPRHEPETIEANDGLILLRLREGESIRQRLERALANVTLPATPEEARWQGMG